MPRKKRTTVWVIAARPLPQSPAPGACCYGEDGKPTETHTKWAFFYTPDSALEWAEEQGIKIDGAMNYVAARDHFEGRGVV